MVDFFISLSGKDKVWGDWIAWQLKEAGYEIAYQHWHFQTGQSFLTKMDEAGRDAKRVIVLVSGNYFESDFTRAEMDQALYRDPAGREGIIVPVKIASYDLKGTILAPRSFIDLTELDEAKARKRLLEGLKEKGPPASAPAYPASPHATRTPNPGFPGAKGVTRPAIFHNVPKLPANFIDRQELSGLKVTIAGDDNRASEPVALIGMGGSGKSVLAAAIVRDPAVGGRYPDGVIWLTLGRDAKATDVQAELARLLDRGALAFATWQEGRSRLSDLTIDKACLIVLDDVWQEEHAEAFSRLGDSCTVLLTARHAGIGEKIGARPVFVQQFEPSAAMEFLARITETEKSDLPDVAAQVAKESGYLPLALATVGANVRRGRFDWTTALTALRRADLKRMRTILPEYEHDSLLAALDVSVQALTKQEAAAFQDLAVFPEDATIPQLALKVLWNDDAADLAQAFVDASLLIRSDSNSYRLHDLYVDYLRAVTKDATPLHQRLVEGYRSRCPGGWHAGPNDGYFFERLPYHLVNAGLGDELQKLLLDFKWLEAKLYATNVAALLNDFELIKPPAPIAHVRDVFRIAAHVLAFDRAQLRAQLYGRLTLGEPGLETLEKQILTAPGPWLRPLGRALTTPKDPKKRIFEERSEVVRTRCIAVLPGGARAVSGGVGGVRIWNLKTGGTLHLLPKPDYISRSRYYEVKALAVTPDGKTIIAASGDGAESLLQVIDAEAGEERKAIHEAPNVNAICTTPDGRYVITGCLQRLRVWNLSTGTIEHDIERMATAVAATADGRYFVACGRDLVTVWNLRSGTVLREFAAEEASNTLVITPDGRLAIVGDKPAKLSGYDLETGRKVVNFEGHQRGLYALALTPDGFRLVSGSHDGTVRVWRVATGELEATFEHLGGAVAVAVTPDGTQCLSAGYDDAVRLWDLSFRGHHATPAKHKGRVRAITFTPDGKYFLSAGEDSAVRVFDVSTLQEVRTLEGHRRDVFAIAVTPDSRYAITGGLDHDVRVWELATGEPVWVMPGHHYCVRGLAVLSDRKRVVSGAEDSTLAVWDLESGMRLSIINSDAGEVQCVGLTSDGTKVIFADQGWSIHVKDIASGELLQTFRGHDERASALTLTPDGRKLISGWLDQKIRIWEFNTGNQLAVFQTKDQVLSVSVIGDKYVVSGEGDGAMRVRDLRTGQVIASLTSDSRSMVAAVAPDGRTLVAGDYGGCVHVVRLEGTEIS